MSHSVNPEQNLHRKKLGWGERERRIVTRRQRDGEREKESAAGASFGVIIPLSLPQSQIQYKSHIRNSFHKLGLKRTFSNGSSELKFY